MLAPVDTGPKCSLIHGNPQKLSGPLGSTDGYGGQVIVVRKVILTLHIGHSPPGEYEVFILPTPENIWGIGMLYKVKLGTPFSVCSASRLE